MRDASNLPMDELLTPEVVSEKMEIELAELAELEAAINDAEEEELWSLTLAAQLKHLQVRSCKQGLLDWGPADQEQPYR